ncbi:MAG: PilZ domain-containing protein [Desulfuromonas sp.]|nr:PilZ domain-containing protein [Desulfuromonas sp.]
MSRHSILISSDVQALLTFDDSFSDREGFTILVADTGSQLLDMARKECPDIIFLVPSMELDQRNCCRLLKEDSRLSDIPVVAIVDSTETTDLDHCQTARPDDILFTPINTHLFSTSARRILGLAHRSFPRLQTSLRIHHGSNFKTLSVACAYNLSTGGIFIATETPPPINAQVCIILELPTTEDPIHCEGIVTWINDCDKPAYPDIPAGYGVQFLSLKIPDLFAIRSYINSRENNTHSHS